MQNLEEKIALIEKTGNTKNKEQDFIWKRRTNVKKCSKT